MKRAAAEQAEQSGNDQIDGDDVVEQPRHDKNEDAGKQRNHGRETEIHVHRGLPWRNGATSNVYRNNLSAFSSVFITPHTKGAPTATHNMMRRIFMTGRCRDSNTSHRPDASRNCTRIRSAAGRT